MPVQGTSQQRLQRGGQNMELRLSSLSVYLWWALQSSWWAPASI